MSFVFSNLELFHNKITEFLAPLPFEIHSRTCGEGESYGEALTCLPCEAGFYLYNVQDEPGTCEPCLETETCYGSNSTAPLPTYWRSDPTSINYIKCFNPDSCLGGDETAPLGRCAEGYDGIMCANCIDRFRRSDAFVCTECSSPSANVAISCLFILIMLIAIVVLVRTTMKGSN